MVDLDREQDIEELRRIAHAQQTQIKLLLEAIAKQNKELAAYKGTKPDSQLTLKMLETLQAKAKAAQEALTRAEKAQKDKPARAPRTSSGPTEQPRLPIIEREFLLDDADRTCPSCGGGLAAMKGQFDESEMIDVVEVEYRVVKVKQQKYVCRCGGCVETAPGPERALPGSWYSLAFAIKVVLDKWLDHIPLDRQVRIHGRHGLIVTSQTLWDLAYAISKRLAIVDDAHMKYALEQPVIGLDQTGWPRLETDATKPWQMWALTAPNVVVHRIRDDKCRHRRARVPLAPGSPVTRDPPGGATTVLRLGGAVQRRARVRPRYAAESGCDPGETFMVRLCVSTGDTPFRRR